MFCSVSSNILSESKKIDENKKKFNCVFDGSEFDTIGIFDNNVKSYINGLQGNFT